MYENTDQLYFVWSELNGCAEDALEIFAEGPRAAAEAYADQDAGGRADGVYDESCAYPLIVRSLDGSVARYDVFSEICVHYSAVLASSVEEAEERSLEEA